MKVHKIHRLDHSQSDVGQKLWKLFQRSYQVEADLVGVSDFPPLKRSSENIRDSDSVFWGILNGQRIAATVELSFTSGLLEICSLVVNPDFFRQGMALALLDFVELEYHPAQSVVETASANTAAIQLYQSRGFVLSRRWMTTFGIEKVELKK